MGSGDKGLLPCTPPVIRTRPSRTRVAVGMWPRSSCRRRDQLCLVTVEATKSGQADGIGL